MDNNILGLFVSFIFILGIFAIAMIVSIKFTISSQVSRKLIHIGVGHWIIIAYYYFTSPWFLGVVPVLFIVINYLSHRYKIIKVMEQADNSLGTVWYAVSLLVVSEFGYLLDLKVIAVTAILVLAYGDGLAAVMGQQYGKKKKFPGIPNKSIVGFLTMFIVSGLVIVSVHMYYRNEFSIAAALLAAFMVALLEVASNNGYDNIFVPIGMFLLLWMSKSYVFSWIHILLIVLTVIILSFAVIKKSLTIQGGIHAFFVATVLYLFGGLFMYIALIMFFVIGSVLSKIGPHKKEIEEKIHLNNGARTTIQVYANAGMPFIFSILFYASKVDLFYILGIISFAAAMADTASSEIGMLSRQTPISILTFKKISTGLSGGITFLGLVSGFIFSLVISLLLFPYGGIFILISSCAGFMGSIIDSILGASIQAKFISKTRDFTTEQTVIEGQSLQLYSGFRKIDNNIVNFLSVLLVSSGALLMIICGGFL